MERDEMIEYIFQQKDHHEDMAAMVATKIDILQDELLFHRKQVEGWKQMAADLGGTATSNVIHVNFRREEHPEGA